MVDDRFPRRRLRIHYMWVNDKRAFQYAEQHYPSGWQRILHSIKDAWVEVEANRVRLRGYTKYQGKGSEIEVIRP